MRYSFIQIFGRFSQFLPTRTYIVPCKRKGLTMSILHIANNWGSDVYSFSGLVCSWFSCFWH